jgi:hypothetical protein
VRVPGWFGPASAQSSKYRPPTPSSSGEVATSTDVAAPCSTLFQRGAPPPAAARIRSSSASLTYRCRLVRMPPGISALVKMPSLAQRRVASTANSTLAVLDWP